MGKILKLAVIGFAAIILIFLLHYFGWSRPAENLVIKSLSSIQRAGQNLNHGVGDFYNSWIKKRDLLAENNDLKNQLEKSLVGQSKINALDDENVLLKKELDFTKTSNVKFAAAQIISGLSDNISRSVMINIGNR